MRNILLLLAIICAILAGGCGSSEQTVSLTRHQLVADSLTGEINKLKSQNTMLENQVASVARENAQQASRIADLEGIVSALKEELVKMPVKPTSPGGNSYPQALQLFMEKSYAESATMFQALLDNGVTPSLEDNCHYWLGECSYGLKQYGEAITHFQKALTYEISEKRDESQMMTARSYAGMGNKEKAKAEYQKLLDTYPASPYVQRATEQMGRL